MGLTPLRRGRRSTQRLWAHLVTLVAALAIVIASTSNLVVAMQEATTPAGDATPKWIRAIVGDAAFTIAQPYGPTEFTQANPSMYEYCKDYGEPEPVHCGFDLAIRFGTALFTPISGTVVCAGTGIGGDQFAGDCAAFACVLNDGQPCGPNAGRFEMMTDRGDRLIFGHLSAVTVQPGQFLPAGSQVGSSGMSGVGDQVHIEVRVPDATTDSGLRVVDPERYFDHGTIADILGTEDYTVVQPYGPTDLAQSLPDLFTYCTLYGEPSGVHCGVDFGIPRGTPLFASTAAAVLVAGGTSAYQDDLNPQAGEFRFQLLDGTQVIYGHMSEIDVAVGQVVEPGDRVGLSGASSGFGEHLHLEVRVLDQTTQSGYRTVDPLNFFAP